MMKYLLFTLGSLAASVALGQDPTTPSKAIVERIRNEPTATAISIAEPKSPPRLVLKAIVMRDANHGTVLVESNGRNYRLHLDRDILQSEQTLDRAPGIQIGGSFYRLQDFNSQSVTLFDGAHSIQVQ